MALFAASLLVATSGEAAKLQGRFRNDTYTSPDGTFTARYQLHGTSPSDPCCQKLVSDGFDAKTGVGVMSFSNEYGAINGVIWGPTAPGTEDSSDALSAWLDGVVMRVMQGGSPQATMLRQEPRDVGGISALLAVVDVPGGATVGEFDVATRTVKRGDSVRGLLVFRRGAHLYALMAEMNVLGFWGENKSYDPAAWDAYLPDLEAFLSTMTFAEQ